MRIYQLFYSLIFILTMYNQASGQSFIQRLDGSQISERVLKEKIDFLMKEARVTGLAVSIFNQDTSVYQKAFGYANVETLEKLDQDHVFYGASLSKAVFGFIVAQLVAEGKIDLDKPLSEYLEVALPELPVEKAFRSLQDLKEDERYRQFTLRMCLAHSTGLPNWRWINNPGEKLKITFDPGSNYGYSGEGIMIAQWVIEHVTKKKLEDLARERVFAPLKMEYSDYLWQAGFKAHFCYGHSSQEEKRDKDIETEDAAAAGSLETTLADYAKFLEQVLKLYRQDSEMTKILFTPNIRIRTKANFGPLARISTNENDAIQLSHALGWGYLQSAYGIGVFKSGHSEGFQHYSILFPEVGIGILLMSNSDNAESIFKELLELSIGDVYTPWKWKNYVPYDLKN